jgi:hypothetical protein
MRVIPVKIGATGTISKPFIKHMSNIPGHHIGHCTHTSESANVKVQKSQHRN